jgi:ElaB/YqjD/DUF883 family membrane-anchored ribosome-binding protein
MRKGTESMTRVTPSRRWSVLAAGVAVISLALVAAGCSSAEEEVKKVDQTIHDDIVRAYDEASSLLASAEGKVEEGTEAAWAEAKEDFDALEAKVAAAKDLAGKEAIAAYREIQHELHRLHIEADTVLHGAGHRVSDAAGSVWHEIKHAYRSVHNAVDHAVDDLHF